MTDAEQPEDPVNPSKEQKLYAMTLMALARKTPA
jgi:hypothetical protein